MMNFKNPILVALIVFMCASHTVIANNLEDSKSIIASCENENKLLFMLGTWKTEGTQYWYDGTWVKHKGIVKCILLDDGVTIERTFWASFDNGVSLGGKSFTVFNPDKNTWSSMWVPTTGNWDAGLSVGRMEGDEYVDVARGSDQTGKFMSKTKIFDIKEDSYKVSTDIHYDSGDISKNNWNITFTKIKEGSSRNDKKISTKNVDFLVGHWIAEGKLQLADGSFARHTSYVDAQLNTDGNLERQFWGSISVGSALRGVSIHKLDNDKKNVWNVQWIPKGSTPAPIAKGSFKKNKFVEVYDQNTVNGTVTIKTKYYDISKDEYKVQTDVLDKDGNINETVWAVHFKRIL